MVRSWLRSRSVALGRGRAERGLPQLHAGRGVAQGSGQGGPLVSLILDNFVALTGGGDRWRRVRWHRASTIATTHQLCHILCDPDVDLLGPIARRTGCNQTCLRWRLDYVQVSSAKTA